MREVNLREKDYQPNQQALLLFSEALARRFACFPFDLNDQKMLTLAISKNDWEDDKMNVKRNQIAEDVGMTSGIKLHFVLAPPKDILWAVKKFYAQLPPVQKPADTLTSLRTSHGDDPLLNTVDEVGELPKDGAKKPHILHLHFKSAEQAGLFLISIAEKLPAGLTPNKVEHE